MNMNTRTCCLWIVGILCLNGCATTEKTFVSMKNYTQGEFYLQHDRYEDCIAEFSTEIEKHPNDAKAHYYLGRCRLAVEENRLALQQLQEATTLNPGNPDYHFWQGVAHAANGQSELERRSYENALAIKPTHAQTLVYIGHNHFEADRYRTALDYYNRALKENPTIAAALYNRALVLRNLQRTPEEIIAWKTYLGFYPDGAFARKAAAYLNRHGRFDYRNHVIGKRTLTLAQVRFEPSSARIRKESFPALKNLARVIAKNTKMTLHIIAYQKNNRELAESRAKGVKQFILTQEDGIKRTRIKVSWFDQPETVKIDRQSHRLDSAVNFIGQSP